MKKIVIVLALLVSGASLAAMRYAPRVHTHEEHTSPSGTKEARVPAFLFDQWKATHPHAEIVLIRRSKLQDGILLIEYR